MSLKDPNNFFHLPFFPDILCNSCTKWIEPAKPFNCWGPQPREQSGTFLLLLSGIDFLLRKSYHEDTNSLRNCPLKFRTVGPLGPVVSHNRCHNRQSSLDLVQVDLLSRRFGLSYTVYLTHSHDNS